MRTVELTEPMPGASSSSSTGLRLAAIFASSACQSALLRWSAFRILTARFSSACSARTLSLKGNELGITVSFFLSV